MEDRRGDQTGIVAVGMLFVLYSLYGATGTESVRRRPVSAGETDRDEDP